MISASGKRVVATQNYLASYVGAKVLEGGGNAFDASIAVSAVLSVVMPHTSGLGGDGFLLAKTPEGIIAYNASGWAPKGLKANRIGARDVNSIVVPGLVDLWDFLQEFTTKPYEELLYPAIKLATDGFNVGRSLHKAIKGYSGNAEWNATFGGKSFSDVIKIPKLGKILKEVAKDPRSFYESVSERLVEGLRREGSPMEVEDFSSFRGERVKPLTATYRGYTLYEIPPNSQGVTTLQLLKMVEISGINERPFNDRERIKRHVELSALAYEDRNKYVADPRFYEVPKFLLDEDYLRRRVSSMPPISEVRDGDTTFFVVGDGENEVGFVQSLFHSFGSGIMVEGVVFNNRGHGFTAGPNKPEGRKRPMHTLSILLAERDEETIIIGCAGADLRPQIHAEVLENYVDFGMEIDEAVAAPRFMYLGDKVIAEAEISDGLVSVGHLSDQVGIVQAMKKKGNKYVAVADPRSEGVALPVHFYT
ncbi:MAG: gamma-glutamyltransferase [Candidatus Aramenus sulfurataquae]|jgi:gamma-glutamyltranspeptidase/glutathione hydrolase|uniref:Gamma-glutamyltransferase n=2 Tax=Candidatus Aramenus sulfurataquae TaxID=1326980 RepID=W7KXM1_9CREN|nr:MAG: gamma-glutamyltransferase [Candidatus Aramenus sulfurataquae]MCL7343178.1 gamma-glutamyltransferase family protein [Candidatus Aramenus sulfurataquae]